MSSSSPEDKKAMFQSLPLADQRQLLIDTLLQNVRIFGEWGVPPSMVMDAFRAFAVTTWISEPDAPATFRRLADELEREQAKRASQKPN